MHLQVKSSLEYGDGIYSSSIAVADSNCSSSKKFMTYDWTVFHTLIFLITPFFVMLALTSDDEDDGPPSGGMMTPVYEGSQ